MENLNSANDNNSYVRLCINIRFAFNDTREKKVNIHLSNFS